MLNARPQLQVLFDCPAHMRQTTRIRTVKKSDAERNFKEIYLR